MTFTSSLIRRDPTCKYYQVLKKCQRKATSFCSVCPASYSTVNNGWPYHTKRLSPFSRFDPAPLFPPYAVSFYGRFRNLFHGLLPLSRPHGHASEGRISNRLVSVFVRSCLQLRSGRQIHSTKSVPRAARPIFPEALFSLAKEALFFLSFPPLLFLLNHFFSNRPLWCVLIARLIYYCPSR